MKTVSRLEYQPADRTLLTARLGNNGALVLAPAQKTGSLTVLKELAAGGEASQVTAADRAREFAFRITLTDEAGLPLSGSVATRGEGGAESGLLALDAQGSMQASLMGGQSLTLADLPENTRFAVEELDAEASGFKAVVCRADGLDRVCANASGGAAGDESAHASENANADGGEGTSGGEARTGARAEAEAKAQARRAATRGGVQRASSSAGTRRTRTPTRPADDAQRTDGSVASGSIAADTRTEAAFTTRAGRHAHAVKGRWRGNGAIRTFLRVRGEAHRHRRRPAFGRLFLHAGGSGNAGGAGAVGVATADENGELALEGGTPIALAAGSPSP